MQLIIKVSASVSTVEQEMTKIRNVLSDSATGTGDVSA